MGDFTAFFPAQHARTAAIVVERMIPVLRKLHGCEPVTRTSEGATVLIAASAAAAPAFACDETGSWIAVKGTLFDASGSDARPALDKLLAVWRRDALALHSFEGTFCLVAWDAVRQRGVALNDQSAILNAYYAATPDGLYVTTSAVPLALALRLPLNGDAVREFLGRGAVLAPRSMFDGLCRLSVGEVLFLENKKVRRGRIWSPYRPGKPFKAAEDAAEEIASIALDRVRRYSAAGGPLLCDLSGGLDSRVVVAAAVAAGVPVGVTVNGATSDIDVQIASRATRRLGWPLLHFDPAHVLVGPPDEAEREELTVRTGGEIVFSAIRLHRSVRPELASRFTQHLVGVGGDFLRYHPWGQEFLRVGRHGTPNIDRLLDYRFLQVARPAAGVLAADIDRGLRADLTGRIQELFAEAPGARNTQHLDAVHLWKMTGHTSLYLSSVSGWMRSGAPLQCAGFLELALSLPWTMRLTTQLQRRVIQRLSPVLASVETAYGGTAAPASLRTAHLEARQAVRRVRHLVRKVASVYQSRLESKQDGPASRRVASRDDATMQRLLALVTGKDARTSKLYNPSALAALAASGSSDARWNLAVVSRMVTLETLCRVVDCEADVRHLTQ
jgi:hypothetical protein